MFSGSMVALVTPMQTNGAIDETALAQLIERHIVAGTSALVVNGTTGESPTLSSDERHLLISKAIEIAGGRIPIIAGTGTNATASTIEQTQQAHALGASACMLVTPYYNKPTQEGLFEHYRAVCESVSVPIILYNVPSRTGVDLSIKTIEKLTTLPNIIGLKEATGDLQKSAAILKACPSLELYSGDDPSSLAFMLQGGKGVISVTANIVPEAMAVMCGAALTRDINLAGEVNTKLMPLHKQLFVEPNPIPIKWAMAQLGWIQEGIRLPLTKLSKVHQENVEEAMKIAGVFECA